MSYFRQVIIPIRGILSPPLTCFGEWNQVFTIEWHFIEVDLEHVYK